MSISCASEPMRAHSSKTIFSLHIIFPLEAIEDKCPNSQIASEATYICILEPHPALNPSGKAYPDQA